MDKSTILHNIIPSKYDFQPLMTEMQQNLDGKRIRLLPWHQLVYPVINKKVRIGKNTPSYARVI